MYAYHERASTCNSAVTRKMAARRRSFTLREKKAAVRVTEEMNDCEAARRFSVSEKLIRDWRKAEASGEWKAAHRDSRAIGRLHETDDASVELGQNPLVYNELISS